ncbi:hypothetical protein BDZ91DRAFT_708595 [Kalaharituber pfeilii]|nr:hypothetical protein BDZ91DRAFT_708595 [Kalaharituber pfeilii]
MLEADWSPKGPVRSMSSSPHSRNALARACCARTSSTGIGILGTNDPDRALPVPVPASIPASAPAPAASPPSVFALPTAAAIFPNNGGFDLARCLDGSDGSASRSAVVLDEVLVVGGLDPGEAAVGGMTTGLSPMMFRRRPGLMGVRLRGGEVIWTGEVKVEARVRFGVGLPVRLSLVL